MKLIAGMAGFAFLITFTAGCKQQVGTIGANASTPANATPSDAIRTAIDAHLAHNGNLRRDSFNTEIKQLTFDGDHAQAQVEFRTKNGPGAMELTYSLEKRNGTWVVAESTPNGSNFSHPSAGMPAQSSGAPSAGDPSVFDALDKLHDHANARAAKLPPGHPPINPNGSTSSQQP